MLDSKNNLGNAKQYKIPIIFVQYLSSSSKTSNLCLKGKRQILFIDITKVFLSWTLIIAFYRSFLTNWIFKIDVLWPE